MGVGLDITPDVVPQQGMVCCLTVLAGIVILVALPEVAVPVAVPGAVPVAVPESDTDLSG